MGERCAAPALKAHALLLPAPFQGHINPFVELGQRLAALDVRVTLVTPDHLHTKILRSQEGLLQPMTARFAHFTLLGLPDGLPDGDHSAAAVMLAVQNLEDPLVELVHTLAGRGFPVTCVVADFYLRWSTSVACRTSLPEFIFWPQCASVFAMYLHVDAFIAAGYDPFSTSDAAASVADATAKVRWISSFCGRDIRYVDLPFHDSRWSNSRNWHEDLIRHRLKHLPKAQGVLMNSFEALEEEVSRALAADCQHLITDPPHQPPGGLRLIGPLTPTSKEERGTSLLEEQVEECMEWLDKQPTCSVIFVSFGSLATMTCEEQVEEVARGLAASGQRFLWVLRKDAIEPSSQAAEAEDGDMKKMEDAVPPDGFLQGLEGKGKVVRWAPQVRVLGHHAVGGFFSHCGWNSILESVLAGVPILGWPSFVDQFTNCRLMSHHWGMGVELQCNSLNETTRLDVARGVKELMQGPHAQSMRSRATHLQKLATDTLMSSRELLTFVDDIRRLHEISTCGGFH